MKNSNRILNALDEIISKEGKAGVTTQEIADAVNMERSLVSRYLNQMVSEGILTKIDKRPVIYCRAIKEQETVSDINKNSIFNDFIGAQGSLEKQIKQCISSVRYPGTGLPLILTGDSGVGKSYLASLIYQYAVEEKIVSKNAKFVVFNCADYANNAELLASKLFGYKKGAFTDAFEDYEGVIAQADGGYLFLDEVHRLSAEGQEKLFLLLDKGIFQPFGDKNYYSVKVRLICATTEDINKAMIQTFLRRIPIQVHLPNLKERPISERLEFIKRFYMKESVKFNKSIKVSNEVMNYLMSCDLEGNIGELSNIVKVSCANAYDDMNKAEMVISLKDIPIKNGQNIRIKKYFKKDYLEISAEEKNRSFSPHDGILTEIYHVFQELHDYLEEDEIIGSSFDEVLLKITEFYKRINDAAYYENIIYSNVFYDQLLYIYMRDGIQMLHDRYGVRIIPKNDRNLANMFHILKSDMFKSDEANKIIGDILDKLESKKFKINILVNRFFDYLESSISYEATPAERLFFTLQMITQFSNKKENNINVIILAHGESTASSIASVVNVLFSDYIIESFDMPIDMQPLDIVEDIKNYAKQLDKRHSAIFLVDMGSLFDIYPMIKESFMGDVAVINNITTQLAISVAGLIHQEKNMLDIIDEIVNNSQLNYKYYEKSARRKVILTACESEIGTANQIRNIIKNCLPKQEEMIDVVTCDYFSLKNLGKNNSVFKKYDVLLIVTTLGLQIPGVKTIIFSEMLTEKNQKILRNVLREVYDDKAIEKIINNLMKSLTLENILSKITILNPSKIVDMVSVILSEIEKTFEYEMSANQKLSLYIHIAIMLERCFFRKNNKADSYVATNSQERLSMLRDIFKENMDGFSIDIPDWELDMIFNMIEEYDISVEDRNVLDVDFGEDE